MKNTYEAKKEMARQEAIDWRNDVANHNFKADKAERKNKMKIAEIKEIAERLGWRVDEYDDGTVEFSQYSPAGEDFSFTVNAKEAAKEIYEYYNDFDIDEHVEMWIEARENGVIGVPSTRQLVEDAEDIFEMLKELACAVMDA